MNLGTIEPFESITYDIDGVKHTIASRDVHENVGFHKRTKEGEDMSTNVSEHKGELIQIFLINN